MKKVRDQVKSVGELLSRPTGQLRQGGWNILEKKTVVLLSSLSSPCHHHQRQHIDHHDLHSLHSIHSLHSMHTNIETMLVSLLGEIFAGQWSKAGTL